MDFPRRKIITRETTSFAPDEIPRTKGLAMGFPKNVCKRKPDTDRAPPRIIAASILGSLISQMILSAVSSPFPKNRISIISLTEISILPELIFHTIKLIRSKARKPKAIQYLRCSFFRMFLSFLFIHQNLPSYLPAYFSRCI